MKTRSLLAFLLAVAFFVIAVPAAEAQTFCVPPSVPPSPPPADDPPTECEPPECRSCPTPAGCDSCYYSPCHIQTGTYVERFLDLNVLTNSFPIQVGRRYVSARMVDGPLGLGWTTSLTPRLYYAAYLVTPPATYSYEVRVRLLDGVLYKFTSSGGNNFVPASLSRKDKLVGNADGSWDLTIHKTDYVLHFDANGIAQTFTDEFGDALGFVYDGQGRLQKLEDRAGSGRYLDVVWGADGRIASVTARHTSSPGTALKSVQYGYAADGTLTSVTNPLGQVTAIVYAAGRFGPLLRSIHDHWDRQVTLLTFDSSDRLTGYTDGDPAWSGESFTYTYYPQFGMTQKTSSTGTQSFNYTANGFRTNGTSQRNPATGQVYSYTNHGYPVSYQYDSLGRLTLKFVSSGVYSVWFKYSYDANYPYKLAAIEPYRDASLITRYTDWRAIYYTYYGPSETAHGRLKQIETLRKDGTTKDVVERFAYDSHGRITSDEQVGVAIPATFTWNAAGDLTSMTDQGTATFGYDLLGRPTTVTNKMGATTTYEYDALDRITAITLPAPYTGAPLFRATLTYDQFDATKNLLFVHETDVNGRVTKSGYDVMENMVERIDTAANLTKYTYTNNLLTKITDANGNETSYTYTANRRKLKTTFPDGTSETLGYSPEGWIASRLDRAGLQFFYSYDGHGRLWRTSWNNGQKFIETEHTGGQMPTAIKYWNGTAYDTTTFTYDSQYRVLTETQNNRGKITYAYFATNPSGRIWKVTAESAAGVPGTPVTTEYGYDSMGRVQNILWSPVSSWYALAYNLNGQYTSITDPYGRTREYQYDGQGRLTFVTNKRNGNTLASFTYAYDYDWNTGTNTMLGQKTSVNVFATTALQQHAGVTKYFYDSRYQLTRTEHATAGTNTWSYDAIGNRLTANANVYNYQQNAQNKNTTRLLNINGAPNIEYDAYGNVKKTGGIELLWDNLGRLLSRKQIATGTQVGTKFEYDAAGRRAVRENAAEKFGVLYDGIHAVSERRMSSTYGRTDSVEYLFGPGVDEPLAVKTIDGSFFYLVDGQGSVIGKESSTYQISDATSYTAFGSPTVQWPETNLGYTAREAVDSTYWYYRARYYDPAIGRFLSEDPLGHQEDVNPYRYVQNSPMMWRDPSGLNARSYAPWGPISPPSHGIPPHPTHDPIQDEILKQRCIAQARLDYERTLRTIATYYRECLEHCLTCGAPGTTDRANCRPFCDNNEWPLRLMARLTYAGRWASCVQRYSYQDPSDQRFGGWGAY